jgi:nitrogen regulatory protein PII
LTLVVGREHKESILKLLLEFGCHLINVVYAKGSVTGRYFKDMLGFVPEEKKVMITCLTTGDVSDQLLERLIHKYNFDKPNTGIAFVIPVDKVSI